MHAELTPEEAVPQLPSEDAAAATFDTLDAPVVDSEPTSAISAKGENISTLPVDNPTHAARTTSPPPAESAETAMPVSIPGVNIIQPTPDNSQDAVQRSFNLIPLGAINAAGMRTRSRSRTRTPAPQETDTLLDAEDNGSKRQRTG
jgi:hypothetical protein